MFVILKATTSNLEYSSSPMVRHAYRIYKAFFLTHSLAFLAHNDLNDFSLLLLMIQRNFCYRGLYLFYNCT